MHPETKAIIAHYQFSKLPVEGTLYKSTYRATQPYGDAPIGSAIIGLYANEPLSVSCFHRLAQDEVWHFYGGDPFKLYLLYPDGNSETIIMGTDVLKGQKVQFVVPAGVWQAGEIITGGKYSLYGCTLAPGFIADSFEAGIASELIKKYPEQAACITRLSVNGHATKLPDGFKD
jgi:predicted cupin superfamily sugar epimerase